MHVQTEHMVQKSEEQPKCVSCGYRYNMETDLQGSYMCKNCGQRTETLDTLTQPVREHTKEPTEKDLMCETCGKQETTLKTLKQQNIAEHLVQPPLRKFYRQNPVEK